MYTVKLSIYSIFVLFLHIKKDSTSSRVALKLNFMLHKRNQEKHLKFLKYKVVQKTSDYETNKNKMKLKTNMRKKRELFFFSCMFALQKMKLFSCR